MLTKLHLFSLLLTTTITIDSCFSADDSKTPTNHSQPKALKLSAALTAVIKADANGLQSPELVFSSPEKVVKLAERAYQVAQEHSKLLNQPQKITPLEVCKSQADLFNDAANLIDLVMPQIQSDATQQGLIGIATTIQALSLQQHGIVLQNIATITSTAISFEAELNLLKQAHDLVSGSIPFFEAIKDQKNQKISQLTLAKILEISGIIMAKEEEKDLLKSLDLFTQGIRNLNASYAIIPADKVKQNLSMALVLAIKKALSIYIDIEDQLQKICQNRATIPVFQNIENTLALANKLLTLLDAGLVHYSELDIMIENLGPTVTKNHTINKRPQKNHQKPPQIIDLQAFKMMIATTYCGLLKKAVMETQNQEYFTLATQVYSNHLYQNQYEDNLELKDRFIAANLDYLIGHPTPLNEFYHTLRQSRIGQRVRLAQLETQQAQSEVSQQKTIPSAKKTYRLPSQPIQPDYSFATSSAPSSSSPYAAPQAPIKKVKTRGPATLSTPEPKASSSETMEAIVQQPTIKLNKDDYAVFKGLVGLTYYRNFTLQAVKHLLANLEFAINPDQGKGGHQKATAQNGQMWIAPKEWREKIPDYYRLQLNDLIQNKMGIDPTFVSQK